LLTRNRFHSLSLVAGVILEVKIMGVERIYFGDELIGMAANSPENSARVEWVEHPFRRSVEAGQPISAKFDLHLLDVAEEIYRVRRKRDVQFEQFFGSGLFCEPAWDMLLDLYINNGRKRVISVSSACLASAVPTTTALRHISELVRRRLLVRSPHPDDRRVYVLHLTPIAVSVMEGLLDQHNNVQKMSSD
jgi:DNA-binding MarR family transcriptional regulator